MGNKLTWDEKENQTAATHANLELSGLVKNGNLTQLGYGIAYEKWMELSQEDRILFALFVAKMFIKK